MEAHLLTNESMHTTFMHTTRSFKCTWLYTILYKSCIITYTGKEEIYDTCILIAIVFNLCIWLQSLYSKMLEGAQLMFSTPLNIQM